MIWNTTVTAEYTALYKYVPDRGVNQQVHDEVNNKHKGDK